MMEKEMEMDATTSRRQFLAAASGAAALGLLGSPRLAPAQAPAFKTRLSRAMIIDKPDEKNLAPLKAAGFDGVETRAIIPEAEAAQCRAIAEKLGMRIHSILIGGAPREKAEAALRAAKGYGANAILLVPGRISVKPLPDPWALDVQFDPKTGHVTRMVKGDNAPLAKYMEAHNQATDQAVASVKELIPLAEKLEVAIGLENVWNNLWLTPEHFCWLVDACANPWVRAYFDVGNHVKFLAPPEKWIRVLGKRVVKIHIKDYKLSEDKKSGKFVHPRDGSINWPAVRLALDEIGYNDFLTIEDGGLPLVEFRQRLDEIIAGK